LSVALLPLLFAGLGRQTQFELDPFLERMGGPGPNDLCLPHAADCSARPHLFAQPGVKLKK